MPLDDSFLLTQLTIDFVDGARWQTRLIAHPNDVKARGLEVLFTNMGLPADMEGQTPVLTWQRSKELRGAVEFEPVDAANGHFKVHYPGAMCQTPGTAKLQIDIPSDGRNIAVVLPDCEVDEGWPVPEPGADDTFSLFAEVLESYRQGVLDIDAATRDAKDATSKADAAAGRADAAASQTEEAVAAADAAARTATEAAAGATDAASEARAQAAEAKAQAQAAKDASDAANSAEAERRADEDARKAAEDARKAAELLREESEDARDEAESGRAAKEAERESSEANRKAAEEKRATDFTASQNANKQAFDAAQNERASAFTAAQGERTQAFEASEKSRQDTFDAAEEKREAGEKKRSDAEALREDAERKRAEKAAADANAEAARVEAEKLRVAAENARVEADGDRSTRQAANDTAQAKNNADQAANNKAAQGLVWVDLAEEQLDPETRIPNFDGEFGKLYFAPAKNPTETDAATEWMWKPTGTGGRWEHVGTSETILPAGIGQEKVQQIHDGEQLSGNGIMYEADLAVYQALLNQDHAGHAKAQKATDDAQDAAIKSVEASVTAAEAKAASDLADAIQSQGATDEAQDTEIEAAKAAAKAAQDAIPTSEAGIKKWVASEAKAHSAASADAASKLGSSDLGNATTPIHLVGGKATACNPYPTVPDLTPYATKAYCDGAIDEAIGKAMEASY